MKKIAIALFGLSVFAGAGYLVFAHTPIGKNSLTKWLLKKWNAAAKSENKKLNINQLKAELNKLKYDDLELLVAYTWIIPKIPDDIDKDTEKRKKLQVSYKKLVDAKILQKADLSQLENIVLPG